MNGAQLHLLLNHLPVVATLLSLPFLLWGLLRKHNAAKYSGLLLLVFGGLSAIPTFLTGDMAEEVIEHRLGVSENLIEAHDDAAGVALAVVLLAGAGALAALWLLRRAHPSAGSAVVVATVLNLIAFGLLAQAAHLGGLIQHPELREGAATPTASKTAEKDVD